MGHAACSAIQFCRTLVPANRLDLIVATDDKYPISAPLLGGITLLRSSRMSPPPPAGSLAHDLDHVSDVYSSSPGTCEIV